jgi:gamma-glutamyltranspeptidase/glutathione hydrolase
MLPVASVPPAATRSARAFGARGMVATAHPLATLVGIQTLAAGGNAVDAAIAIAAAQNVLLPASCGLGGDVFAVLFEARTGQVHAFCGSGVAGNRATLGYYRARGHQSMPLAGVHSASVPGAPDAYTTLLERFGTRSLAELLGPAIGFAEEGVPLTDAVAAQIAGAAERLGQFASSRRVFLPDGVPPVAGTRFRQPDLAASLRTLARDGARSFYQGSLAERILDFCQGVEGPFEGPEWAGHRGELTEPIATSYRGAEVYTTPPPSQGLLVLAQLNLLEGFDLGATTPGSADWIHLLVEAKKLAFADRLRYCGDPRVVDLPLAALISREFADRRRREIDPQRAREPAAALPECLHGDTTSFVVTDRDGNAVSFIHSLSAAFGSGLVAGDTGILLNNRAGRGFTLEEGHPNQLAPGKRTMHTLNCYLVCRDGRPWLVGGTPGGDQQPQWNVQVLSNLLDHQLDPQTAAEQPRFYSFPGTDPANAGRAFELRLEDRIPAAVRDDLARRGHRVVTLGPWGAASGTQLIQIDHQRGIFLAASDPRAAGVALGF